MIKNKNQLLLILFLLLGLSSVELGAILENRSELENLQHIIKILTSQELSGRDVPSAGGQETAEFIYSWLDPRMFVGEELSAQNVPLQKASLNSPASVISLIGSEKMFLSQWGEQFFLFPRRIEPVDLSSGAIFCGYGISIPEESRNDYPEDVRGKAAVVMAGSDLPAEKVGMRAHAAFKAVAAERAGAVALVVVYTDSLWPPQDLRTKIEDAKKPVIDLPLSEGEFPLAFIHLPGAMEEEIKSYGRVNLRVNFSKPVETTSANIFVKKPGLTDEWIVVGAHYDHLGPGYPGADDNASGVSGLLTLAERFGSRQNLKRSVLFVWFTAEEDGLLGSKWFVKNLPVAKEKIVAMINLDMIGREGFASMREAMKPDAKPVPGYAAAYFSGGSPALRDLIRAASSGVELSVNIQPVNTFRHFGDAGPFHDAQIPTMHIFSGFHADYHAITDTPDKIDYLKLERMIDLTERILENLVETPERPTFDPSIKALSGGMGY